MFVECGSTRFSVKDFHQSLLVWDHFEPLSCVDVVSATVDQVTADFERRVKSGPKERTPSSDTGQIRQSLSADHQSVLAPVSCRSFIYYLPRHSKVTCVTCIYRTFIYYLPRHSKVTCVTCIYRTFIYYLPHHSKVTCVTCIYRTFIYYLPHHSKVTCVTCIF